MAILTTIIGILLLVILISYFRIRTYTTFWRCGEKRGFSFLSSSTVSSSSMGSCWVYLPQYNEGYNGSIQIYEILKISQI
jgi:hypothetical protein